MIQIQQLIAIVKEASKRMIVDHFSIMEKGGCENIVTSSDLAVQHYLCERLSEELPGCGFLCEEEDQWTVATTYTWIIDPIDGTANYSRGIQHCAICVGLREGDQMIMSVVYLPRTNELFHAERGKGAFLNGQPIHVSQRTFKQSILCTALAVYHKEFAPCCANIILDTFMQCNDIRRFGAAAPELCYLAMGRCELYFEYQLSPWDFAAASLIVEEAGGHLYTLMWGEAPAKPIWSVQGHSTLVGNVPGLTSTLEAYADGRYILRDWYGVEKYDLEFRLRLDGGIELLDYYWTTETGERFVQCRREDIGYAAIPQQADQPNGGLEGDAHSGRLHFRMTAHQNDDQPIADPAHPEFVFEW